MLGIGRREFISLLGGAAAAWPLAARAQPSRKVPRIGVLLPGTAASFALRTKAFLEGLRDLGYVEGQTIAIEWRWGQDQSRGASGACRRACGAQCRRPCHRWNAGSQGAQERDRNDTDCHGNHR